MHPIELLAWSLLITDIIPLAYYCYSGHQQRPPRVARPIIANGITRLLGVCVGVCEAWFRHAFSANQCHKTGCFQYVQNLRLITRRCRWGSMELPPNRLGLSRWHLDTDSYSTEYPRLAVMNSIYVDTRTPYTNTITTFR